MTHVDAIPSAALPGSTGSGSSLARIALVLSVLLLGVSATSVRSQTDIEVNFRPENSADFSGTYVIGGLAQDSTRYNGTLKLDHWHTLTTPGGNKLQSYTMEYRIGDGTSNGVAVYDGSRMYFACAPGESEDYYLLLLGKLQFSAAVKGSLAEYDRMLSSVEDGKFVEWEDGAPWYGYLDIESNAYGFWFWVDGSWGQFSSRKGAGMPFAEPDSGSWKMLELEEDGGFVDVTEGSPMGYWESGGYWTRPTGDNLTWWMRHSSASDSASNNYIGTGMMTTHPRTGAAMMVAIMGGPDDANVGVMEVSGKTLKGTWALLRGDGRGTETWDVPDEVISKNSWLFK